MWNIILLDMEKTLENMTGDELKSLIQDTVKETIEDYMEDLTALLSENYKQSVKEAREEYNSGETIPLEDIE